MKYIPPKGLKDKVNKINEKQKGYTNAKMRKEKENERSINEANRNFFNVWEQLNPIFSYWKEELDEKNGFYVTIYEPKPESKSFYFEITFQSELGEIYIMDFLCAIETDKVKLSVYGKGLKTIREDECNTDHKEFIERYITKFIEEIHKLSGNQLDSIK